MNKLGYTLIAAGLTIWFGATIGQVAPNYTYRDYATLIGPTTALFELCWRLDPLVPQQLPADRIQFRRTRVEGGTPELLPSVPRSQWRTVGSEFCSPILQKLPRSGHYIYEVQACAGAQCADWRISTNPAHAYVRNIGSRAWWIYGHGAPPGQPIPINFHYEQEILAKGE